MMVSELSRLASYVVALSTHDLASYALERGDAGARCDVVELVFGRMYTAIAQPTKRKKKIIFRGLKSLRIKCRTIKVNRSMQSITHACMYKIL